MIYKIPLARLGRMIPVLIFLALCALPAVSMDLQAEAAALFQEGCALVDKNHHDSTVATKEGLERGIELVRRSLELGYPDIQAAYLKLAEALNDLAFSYYERESEQFGDIANHRDQLYRRLLALFPNSAEVLYENAFLAEEAEERKALLRRGVEADPNHAESSFYLGMQLMEEGDFEEGLPLARRGVENCDALLLRSFGQDVLQALRRAGRIAEAKEFNKRFKELLREKLWIPSRPDEE